MKKPSGRRDLLTRVYRMCYTSTFGLVMFTFLNVYCNANNVTEVTSTSNGTGTKRFRFLTQTTWLRGFESCKDAFNLTMASADDIKDMMYRTGTENSNHSTVFKEIQLPVWTYAFEVKNKTSGKTLRIKRSDAARYNYTYQCAASNGTKRTRCCGNVKRAEKNCRDQPGFSLHIPVIQPTDFISYVQLVWLNSSHLIIIDDETKFLTDSRGLSVRCLLLDENGELRTDDCNARHKTLCLGGNTQQVLQYVGNATLPPYKGDPSGRSSNFNQSSSTPTKQDSNSTNFSTVNISTYPVRDNSGIWMDPQIRYSIIAVVSFIVLAILVAVLFCCCRKRRKTGDEKRKSTRLADTYSETADSIAMKETGVYETADTSEYAIPDDAVKKARHRQSIGENEYDVISNSNKTQSKFSGNAYNHVAIVSSKDRRGSSNQDENTYDVTNFGKQNTIVLSPNDLKGNVYGEIAVKTER